MIRGECVAIYECVIYDKEGNRKSVKLEFDSEYELNSYALEKELKIADIKLIKEKSINKVKNKELSTMCNQLGMLISSGCEITNSINTIQSNCSHKLKSILKKVNYNLQKGSSISTSFQNTNMFSNFFINMLKAGEVSGKLDEILISLSNFYKKEYDFKNKLMTAMIYPILLVVVCILVILFMLIYAVPSLQASFISNETNLPVSTKILIEVSSFFRDYYELIIILGIILLLISYKFISKSYKLKLYFDERIFKFKFSKVIIQTIEVSKFIRCFYILISSGIQVIDALDISSNVIKNRYIKQRLYLSKDFLQRGNSITNSLEVAGVFPKIDISMIEVGEETGSLEKCLYSITTNYDNDLDNFINKIVKSIEPIIISIMGISIGAIVISMMIPIFDAVTSFQ
ncbi:type II secretion system F family protein [Paraclostridium tenue]|uniref:Type II secretion system F family protein n=1 Tax=Paraclostridium tenue TaxID=1737 RepID=A0ABN1M9U4_9FIRM